MAKADNNVLLAGLSGSIGKQVTIKQRGGKTIVSKAQKARDKAPTEKQQEAQDKFTSASAYAKGVLEDPDMLTAYKSSALVGQNAYNIALKDAYNPPEIQHIHADKYQGKPGDLIVVRAVDDFRVFRVTVAIHSAEGALVEKGNAMLGRNGKDWVYETTLANNDFKGGKVIVWAEDLPGNMTTGEVGLT